MNNMTAEIVRFKPLREQVTEPSTSQTNVDFPGKENSTGGDFDLKIGVKQLQNLLTQLNDVFSESKILDWGGNGAEPISDAAYYNATRLLAVLPVGLPAPEILPDNDGYIEFEWSKGDKNFSLYITDTNLVLFAGFYGKEDRLSGRFNFEGKFPNRPENLARDVYQEDP